MLMAGRLTERFGAGRTAVTGSAATFLATVPFVMVQADTSYVTTSVLTSLQAFGLGLAGMPVMIAAYRTLRPSQVHDATPQQNILQRLGGSMGAAILAAVLTSQLAGAGSSPSAQADPVRDDILVAARRDGARLDPDDLPVARRTATRTHAGDGGARRGAGGRDRHRGARRRLTRRVGWKWAERVTGIEPASSACWG